MDGPTLALLAPVLAVSARGARPTVAGLTGDPVVLDTLGYWSHSDVTHYLLSGVNFWIKRINLVNFF